MTKLVFVDGPNGVGKDSFVWNLARLLEENNKTFVMKNINNYMPNSDLIIDISKFNKEFFVKSLYNIDVIDAHINCVNDVVEIADQGKYDYVLVNGSIISYLVYNTILPKSVMDLHNIDYSRIETLTEEHYRKMDFGVISIYDKLLKAKSQTFMLFLYNNLSIEENVEVLGYEMNMTFSDYEKLILTLVFSAYDAIYRVNTKKFYYFNKKYLCRYLEYDVVYKLLEEDSKELTSSSS
jgi:hypothetical protein